MLAKQPLHLLVTLAAATLLASLGVSIATVVLPTLSREFVAPIAGIQWVVLAYLLSTTVTIVLVGRLGDLFGLRRILLAGTALFALAGMICIGAPTLGVLVLGRAIQGIGGAVLVALPLSIVREMVSKERTGSALGLLGTMSAMGTALGPSVGGMLISELGWRAAFGGLAMLGILVFALALQFIPASPARSYDAVKRMDWLGGGFLAITLTLYALATAGGKIVSSWGAAALLAATLVTLVIFLVVESRSAAPLVPLSMLRSRPTATALAANLLVSTVMMATLVVGPLFLSFALRLSDANVGLVMAVGPVTAALTGVIAGRVTDRFGAHPVLMAGLVEIVVGLACLALLPRFLGVAGYIAALMVLTPGFQLFLAANSTTLLLPAAEGQRGLLSGLLGLSRNLGFMTGASVMATLFAVATGSEEIAQSAPHVIGDAFTTTFLVASAAILPVTVFAFRPGIWSGNQTSAGR